MTGLLTPAAAGLGTGFALIVAVGAQNAFLLRQGMHREHHLLAAAFCSLADLVVITGAVAGIGTVVARAPGVLGALRVAGVVYLAGYGVLALRRALSPGALAPAGRGGSLPAVMAACAAVTLLNPHLYLDVAMLGSIANTYGAGRWAFATGVIAASITWFFGLAVAASRLARLLSRPGAWRIVDLGVAAIMMTLAVTLATGAGP